VKPGADAAPGFFYFENCLRWGTCPLLGVKRTLRSRKIVGRMLRKLPL